MIIHAVMIIYNIAVAVGLTTFTFWRCIIFVRGLDFVVLSSNKYLEASPSSNDHVSPIGVVVAPLCHDISYNDCLLRTCEVVQFLVVNGVSLLISARDVSYESYKFAGR